MRHILSHSLYIIILKYVSQLSWTDKEGAYAISMGINHRNNVEHSLGIRHIMADDNLDTATLRFCNIRWTRFSDHCPLHSCLDLEIIFLEKDF